MMTCSRVLLRLLAFGAGLLCASLAQARTVFITDDHGQALPLVMVTQVYPCLLYTSPSPRD